MAQGLFERYPVKTVLRENAAYPARLRDLKKMPGVLHYRGRLPGTEPAVAIVGSRRCTPYGRWQAEFYAKVLAENHITVISGMAAGIDAIAQRAALMAGGVSFGVLGTGVDVCYPPSSRDLYEMLLEKGGVISEYDNGTPPLGYHFPSRNRLISALADVVIVVEAAEKSGSLITADFALEQGRSVFAVPGRIGDIHSEGCLRLIAEGAYVALSPDAVIRELYRVTGAPNWDALEAPKPTPAPVFTDVNEETVWQVLSHEAMSTEDIIEKTGLDVRACAVALASLTEKRLVDEPYDQAYVRRV